MPVPRSPTANATYREALRFTPGTSVHYRFWRELDLEGAAEEIEQGELVVGASDEVVHVTYSFDGSG